MHEKVDAFIIKIDYMKNNHYINIKNVYVKMTAAKELCEEKMNH